ncbi:hypothetical protein [Microcystis aeruginosa]|nr:hypothetical protein [Microcystis aeruginosa]
MTVEGAECGIKVNLIPPESQGSKLKSKDDLPSQSYQVQAGSISPLQ